MSAQFQHTQQRRAECSSAGEAKRKPVLFFLTVGAVDQGLLVGVEAECPFLTRAWPTSRMREVGTSPFNLGKLVGILKLNSCAGGREQAAGWRRPLAFSPLPFPSRGNGGWLGLLLLAQSGTSQQQLQRGFFGGEGGWPSHTWKRVVQHWKHKGSRFCSNTDNCSGGLLLLAEGDKKIQTSKTQK